MFSHGCEGDAARQRCCCPCTVQGGGGRQRLWRCTNQRGYSLSQKRISPLEPQEKGFDIASKQLEELQCLPIALPIARRCRVWICYTIWVTSTTRCRSADLVEVRTNFRLPEHSTMRRASAMPLFRTQSAAKQTSLAPHDSKARLQAVTTRRDSWRSHVHRTYTAQRVQLFEPQTANVRGQGARPLAFSWGIKRGPFSHVREWPPLPVPLPAGKQHASPAGGNYCFFLIRINGVHWSS